MPPDPAPRFTITRDWTTAAGLRAVSIRTAGGWLCGYVGVPSDHPLHGKGWDQLEHLDVHGGVTHGSNNHPIHSSTLWWIGFDCAHAGDGFGGGGTPKSQDFVNSECERLAVQLVEPTPVPTA